MERAVPARARASLSTSGSHTLLYTRPIVRAPIYECDRARIRSPDTAVCTFLLATYERQCLRALTHRHEGIIIGVGVNACDARRLCEKRITCPFVREKALRLYIYYRCTRRAPMGIASSNGIYRRRTRAYRDIARASVGRGKREQQ